MAVSLDVINNKLDVVLKSVKTLAEVDLHILEELEMYDKILGLEDEDEDDEEENEEASSEEQDEYGEGIRMQMTINAIGHRRDVPKKILDELAVLILKNIGKEGTITWKATNLEG